MRKQTISPVFSRQKEREFCELKKENERFKKQLHLLDTDLKSKDRQIQRQMQLLNKEQLSSKRNQTEIDRLDRKLSFSNREVVKLRKELREFQCKS